MGVFLAVYKFEIQKKCCGVRQLVFSVLVDKRQIELEAWQFR